MPELLQKGVTQEQRIDVFEIFALVAKYRSIRFFLATAVHYGWHQKALNFKTALLNADLEQKLFVSQAEGIEDERHPRKVYKLYKALYGLNQASRQWFFCLKSFQSFLRFRSNIADSCLFTSENPPEMLVSCAALTICSPQGKTLMKFRNGLLILNQDIRLRNRTHFRMFFE